MDREDLAFDALRMWFWFSIVATIYMGIQKGISGVFTTIGISLLVPIAIILVIGVIWLFWNILELIHWFIFG